MVQSKFETTGIGALFGIRFFAEVDTGAGSTKVDFIVKQRVLARDDEIDENNLEIVPLRPAHSSSAHPAESAAWN